MQNQSLSLTVLLIVAAHLCVVDAHGRLTVPMPRKGGGYEDDPVKGGNVAEAFVCRHASPNPKVPIQRWAAGSQIDIRWDFGANHVGDCALFLSYDTATARKDQKFFKIANFPECNKDNKNAVKVNLPRWLPPGDVVLRWDWYALHVFPGNVEFYSQCSDAKISSSSTISPTAIPAYSIINPPVYPSAPFNGKYRNPWNPSGPWFMTGPKCVGGVVGNCCDTSSYKKGTGYSRSPCSTSGTSGPAPDGSNPTPTNPVAPIQPVTPPAPTTDTSIRCGNSWADASSRCGTLCPGGTDDECPSSEKCFRDLPANAACASTPTPPTPPTPVVGAAPCDDGSAGSCKKQCQSKCIALTGGVKVNQCWGSPKRYIECKCDDGSTHSFAGCACEHANCAQNPTPVAPVTPVAPPATPPTPPSSDNEKVIRDTVAKLRAQAAELNAMADRLEATLTITGAQMLIGLRGTDEEQLISLDE